MRASDRLKVLEAAAAAVSRQLVVVDSSGVPTDAEIAAWEVAAHAGHNLFIAGPGLDWGWVPGTDGPKPWCASP